MDRTRFNNLKDWFSRPDRKPLVIRGARQVGKTWLVRHLAKEMEMELIELNLEKKPSYAELFESNNPHEILFNLRAILNKEINPEKSILFIDEVQIAPEMLNKLRWFLEDMPELPVVAAGSLLEFVLEEHSFDMPVGRINYLHLEPLTFEEFLLATNNQSLANFIHKHNIGSQIPQMIHEQLMNLFREYIVIGGMPEAVKNWSEQKSLPYVNQIQHDLLSTYRDDFTKYNGKIDTSKIDKVMLAVPRMLSKKIVYSKLLQGTQSATTKKILELLEKARICHKVKSTSANGLPLAAEVKEKSFKEIFLDIGLCCSALGIGLGQVSAPAQISLVNQGAISEQVVGQLLRTIERPYIEPVLYYWQRDHTGSTAEVDYILQHQNTIVPIEVKSGSTGSMKSLHMFVGLKGLDTALRINSAPPNITIIETITSLGTKVKYRLISIPYYMIGQLHRILKSEMAI